jgi:hypothetical protein
MLSTRETRSLITEAGTSQALFDIATDTRRLRQIARDHESVLERSWGG